jgi:uncharacterized membrane protein YcaP (DUF421 family)
MQLYFLSTIAARSAIVMLALIVGIRLFGKRQASGMNIYDLVLVLLLANAVQNAITAGSGYVGVGLVAAGTLVGVDRLLGLVFTKNPRLESQLVGSPTVVVQDGRFLDANCQREGVTHDEILTAIREYGLPGVKQVRLAVLEADGSVSVVPAK